MAKVTDISPQQRKTDRVNVYLDGVFCCGLQKLTVLTNKLKIGDEISKERLEQIQLESEISYAFERVVEYIATRLKTEKEMRDYLQKKGYLTPVVDAVVEKLKEYRLVDDKLYAESYVKTYSASGGKRKLEYDLKRKGVREADFAEAVESFSDDNNSCMRLSVKYMKNKETSPESLNKLSRHLAGRGFSWDVIKSCIDKIKKEEFDQ